MGKQLQIRPVTDRDLDFLINVFQSTRLDIMSAEYLPLAQREELVLSQYRAQHQHYQTHFPNADYGVIQLGNQRIGRLYLNRSGDEIHLIDISILPEFRGQGIGQTLIAAIQQEAKMHKKKVRLHVEKANRARRLYLRNGFRQTNETTTHFEMTWDPAADAIEVSTSDGGID